MSAKPWRGGRLPVRRLPTSKVSPQNRSLRLQTSRSLPHFRRRNEPMALAVPVAEAQPKSRTDLPILHLQTPG